MAARIHPDDIAEVRNRGRIDEIVSSYLTLRKAGSGSLKGLCPFHDEKTPSFQVTPSRGFFYCFGCGEGGDVITFLQKIDNLTFAEAVERLAGRTGLHLRYTDDDPDARVERGLRMRILDANAAAAEWFAAQLATPEALPARQFLDSRGFDRAAAQHFGVGYAPKGGRELNRHLTAAGFAEADLVKAGLVRATGHDFFQGRVLWPISESGAKVLGFGARRIFDDDRMPAKYVNTPETPAYKKSQVLYGIDLARQAIGKQARAVVVEGYTDVMAAQLAGVEVAVAVCGTAFGEDHARLLQRLIGQGQYSVIFAFDGDAAGQRAALKVFELGGEFVQHAYVAIEPSELDPCDLRLQHGDAAVRELIARTEALPAFVIRNEVRQFDLDRPDGRVAAVRQAAATVALTADAEQRDSYSRVLASEVGHDIEEVRAEVERARRRGKGRVVESEAVEEPTPAMRLGLPDPADRELAVERGICQLIVQQPGLFSATWYDISDDDFTHPGYAAVYAAARAAQQSWAAGGDWVQAVRASVGEVGDGPDRDAVDHLIASLTVEPLLVEPDQRYAQAYAAKLQLLTTLRDIANLKSKLQRTNPVEEQQAYNRMFSDLLGLENRRKELLARSVGVE